MDKNRYKIVNKISKKKYIYTKDLKNRYKGMFVIEFMRLKFKIEKICKKIKMYGEF